jgi:hypothetical protein
VAVRRIIQHLIFKALFELSADRADFISRLFSRERPSGDGASIQDIWKAVPAGPGTDRERYLKNRAAADNAGVLRSFLGSEENFRFIKSMQERNLIVPVEADIAGPRAVRGIGDYVRARNAKVTVFYISNVEQYLFGRSVAPGTDINGGWKGFYDNLATLPIEPTSVLVRGYGTRYPAFCRVPDFLKAVAAGRVQSFAQAQQCGN